MRTITITIEDGACGYDVHENGKCCGGLSWDEMLGHVAMITMPVGRIGIGFRMRTSEEWEAWKADQFRDATKIIDETSAPAIVFYPSGSLGEPVESEGGEA